jgi:hypothetical protein
VAIAPTWVEVRADSDPIPPVLLLIAVWILDADAPALADDASARWQLAHFVA